MHSIISGSAARPPRLSIRVYLLLEPGRVPFAIPSGYVAPHPRSQAWGNHRAWFRSRSGVHSSQTSNSPSMIDENERDEGIRMMPGDSL